jgi:uncharacterized membrane protein
MDGFEPASLLPELDSIFSKFEPAARILVLVGPVVLILMGLMYLFAVPKEANYYLGYRCYYGMGSVEAWRFTQRLAGIVFGALGVVLLITMVVISGGFEKLEVMDLLWRTIYCVGGEAAAALIATLAVNIVVTVRFDSRGDLRKNKVKR